MADMTIYKSPTLTVTVIDGDPPIDNAAQVAQLTADLAAANEKVANLVAAIHAARTALPDV
jgi:hypothetical protein